MTGSEDDLTPPSRLTAGWLTTGCTLVEPRRPRSRCAASLSASASAGLPAAAAASAAGASVADVATSSGAESAGAAASSGAAASAAAASAAAPGTASTAAAASTAAGTAAAAAAPSGAAARSALHFCSAITARCAFSAAFSGLRSGILQPVRSATSSTTSPIGLEESAFSSRSGTVLLVPAGVTPFCAGACFCCIRFMPLRCGTSVCAAAPVVALPSPNFLEPRVTLAGFAELAAATSSWLNSSAVFIA